MLILREGKDMAKEAVKDNLECANFGFCCRGSRCYW